MQRVVIRTDASIQIGSGHVMRCLALADALRDAGASVKFICREHLGHLCDFIQTKGFGLCRLPAPGDSIPDPEFLSDNLYNKWLGVSWQQDAQQVEQLLEKIKTTIDWLIVDHYALDYRWENRMRHYAKNIMVIDDLADRKHDCDLLLDQNFYESFETRYENLLPPHCKKFLGPEYALLRPEFRAMRETQKPRDGIIRKIFICFGSVDASNETGKTLKAIQLLGRTDITIDVVFGINNPHYDEIRQLCDAGNINFYPHADNIAMLMTGADLSIGAGGATTWERCCLGLPSLIISLAKNQEAIASAMAEAGYTLYLGKGEEVSAGSVRDTVHALLLNPGWVRFLANASASLVDGRGVLRIMGFILEDNLVLRPASALDCKQIYLWRNAQENREYALDPLPISFTDHETWFKDTLENPDRVLLIGEIGEQQIGVLRYDMRDDQAKVSVYLVPGKHGQGYGTRLLKAGSSWLLKHKLEVKEIVAEVLPDNFTSASAFMSAGYSRYLNIFRQKFESGQ